MSAFPPPNANRLARRTEYAGNPRRAFGYPPGWTRNDPRDRDPQSDVLAALERIERLLTERLP